MEKVLLVGVNSGRDAEFERSMEELENLAQACDLEVAARTAQNLSAVNTAFYIGSGKVEEVGRMAQMLEVQLIIFNDSLTPTQQRNLQKALDLPVWDRTGLILEIFGRRARTREARLQVESARLQYMLPRLVGMREALSRQGGGAGAGGGYGAGGGFSNRGAGETKLELDRRKIERRLAELRRELEIVEKDRRTQRKRREGSELPSVALVGYTNAGKSTLLNALLARCNPTPEKQVMEKDMLFATLDTTVRRISPGDHRDFLLSDTVGFIDKLPHGLIKAFRSTLEEACSADLLLIVSDVSDEHFREQLRVTQDTLRQLGAEKIPCLYVMNKADRTTQPNRLPRKIGDRIYLSAKAGIGLEELLEMIREKLFSDYVECEMRIPYTDGAEVSWLRENALVRRAEYREDGLWMRLSCKRSDAGRFGAYIVSGEEKGEAYEENGI